MQAVFKNFENSSIMYFSSLKETRGNKIEIYTQTHEFSSIFSLERIQKIVTFFILWLDRINTLENSQKVSTLF